MRSACTWSVQHRLNFGCNQSFADEEALAFTALSKGKTWVETSTRDGFSSVYRLDTCLKVFIASKHMTGKPIPV